MQQHSGKNNKSNALHPCNTKLGEGRIKITLISYDSFKHTKFQIQILQNTKYMKCMHASSGTVLYT